MALPYEKQEVVYEEEDEGLDYAGLGFSLMAAFILIVLTDIVGLYSDEYKLWFWVVSGFLGVVLGLYWMEKEIFSRSISLIAALAIVGAPVLLVFFFVVSHTTRGFLVLLFLASFLVCLFTLRRAIQYLQTLVEVARIEGISYEAPVEWWLELIKNPLRRTNLETHKTLSLKRYEDTIQRIEAAGDTGRDAQLWRESDCNLFLFVHELTKCRTRFWMVVVVLFGAALGIYLLQWNMFGGILFLLFCLLLVLRSPRQIPRNLEVFYETFPSYQSSSERLPNLLWYYPISLGFLEATYYFGFRIGYQNAATPGATYTDLLLVVSPVLSLLFPALLSIVLMPIIAGPLISSATEYFMSHEDLHQVLHPEEEALEEYDPDNPFPD